MTPKLVVLGVYKPEIRRAVFRQQWRVTGSDELTDAHFKDLVLIEAQVEDMDGRFKMIEMGQPDKLTNDPKRFQCVRRSFALSGWDQRDRARNELR